MVLNFPHQTLNFMNKILFWNYLLKTVSISDHFFQTNYPYSNISEGTNVSFQPQELRASIKDGDPPEGKEKAEISILRDGHTARKRIAWSHINSMLNFLRNCQITFCSSTYTILHFQSNVQRFQLLHILAKTLFPFFFFFFALLCFILVGVKWFWFTFHQWLTMLGFFSCVY